MQEFVNCFFLQFDNDNEKIIYLTLKKEKKSKHFFVYGESHTAYTDADFHVFALNVVSYISKQIGCKFYVNDATGYLENRSDEKHEKVYEDYYSHSNCIFTYNSICHIRNTLGVF